MAALWALMLSLSIYDQLLQVSTLGGFIARLTPNVNIVFFFDDIFTVHI
jgi:hypothetical protein